MSTTPHPTTLQQTEAARDVLLDMAAERKRVLEADGERTWLSRLEREATKFFTDLGFEAEQAQSDVAHHIGTGPDRGVLLETLVAEQRCVSKLGAEAAIKSEMEMEAAGA